jgi:DNA-binding GntR family transcriptional regulator
MAESTLKEKAYLKLRAMILNGELNPGAFLTERMLVEQLEMSRTPIRAALERLDVEGLANYTPNKGLVVAELSLGKAVDIYDFRMAMESYIVRKLASRAWAQEDKDWFVDNLAQQREYAERNDYTLFTEADAQFHRKLAQVYENLEIVQAMEQLQDKLYRIALNVLRKDNSRIRVSYEDHEQIFNHIIENEPDKAVERLVQHLEFGKRILIS